MDCFKYEWFVKPNFIAFNSIMVVICKTCLHYIQQIGFIDMGIEPKILLISVHFPSS